jgi:hypothetical protein
VYLPFHCLLFSHNKSSLFPKDNAKKLTWLTETKRNTMPDKGCDYQTCDNGFCHPLVPPVGQVNKMMEIAPKSEGGEGFFTMEVKQCDCAGKPTGSAVYQIYKGGTKESIAEVEFVFKCYPSGRLNLENFAFRVAPNPVSDHLNIRLPEGSPRLRSITITDITGKTIDTPAMGQSFMDFCGTITEQNISSMMSNNDLRVNVNDLPAGIYLIRLTDVNGNTHNQKFIKE